MRIFAICLVAFALFAAAECAAFLYAEDFLRRDVRQTDAEIRQSIRRPQINPNTGASSSSSITSVSSINQPTSLNGSAPSLKLGEALSVDISIQGPEGPATNNAFANTQLFNTNPNTDSGQAFANGGPNGLGSNTGTSITLQGTRGFGQANAFNQANANTFHVGGLHQGTGTQSANALAVGGVIAPPKFERPQSSRLF